MDRLPRWQDKAALESETDRQRDESSGCICSANDNNIVESWQDQWAKEKSCSCYLPVAFAVAAVVVGARVRQLGGMEMMS